jgi:ferredoxin-NADP reductase
VTGNVHEAAVVGVTPLARGVVEWRFRADHELIFRPGQFLSVRVGEDDGGAAVMRSYSLASDPGEPEFALVLKLMPGGIASQWFQKLKLGDQARFTGPMGFFVNDLQHHGDVVFGATGVGIAPVLPMLRELLARPHESGRIKLYWGNRDAEELFWVEELRALEREHERLSIQWFLTGNHQTDVVPAHKGRINQSVLDDLAALDKPVFYLVGNGSMIRDVKKSLMERGIDRKKQIRNEVFFE